MRECQPTNSASTTWIIPNFWLAPTGYWLIEQLHPLLLLLNYSLAIVTKQLLTRCFCVDVKLEKTQQNLRIGVESFDKTALKHTDTVEKVILPGTEGNSFA